MNVPDKSFPSVQPTDAPLPLAELRGHGLRRALGIVTFAWLFGSVWMTATSGAPITLFAKNLGATELQFGLLSALPYIASLLSLPASLAVERTGERKTIFLWSLYFNRLLWIPIAVLPIWIVSRYGWESSGAAMTVLLILVFVMHAGQAVGGPAWTSWMADIVPERSRGKYFSRRRQWGLASGAIAALAVGWVLDRYARGTGDAGADGAVVAGSSIAAMTTVLHVCAGIFIVSCVFGLLDIFLFHYVPDIRKAPRRGMKLIRAMRGPLHDREFLWFGGFVATLVFAVSFMGQFVTLYVMQEVGVRNTGVQLMLLVTPMVAQFLVLPVWGRAADRMGKKPVLVLAGIGIAPVGIGWCLLSSEHVWLGYVLTALGAVMWTGVEVANLNLVLEMSGSAASRNGNGEKSGTGSENTNGGSAYFAVNCIIVNVAGCLGGLASGLIATWLRDWR
ncbi:MAG: MFS transporter, partial [Tepidisphaeraceae bacterium]